MISVKNVKKSFDDNQVLKDISFEIKPGERVSLIGPGGSGKTVILKIILGLEKPDEGTSHVKNIPLGFVSDEDAAKVRAKMGMAFQQGGLFDFMTVKENLFFAMEYMTKLSLAQMKEKMRVLLEGVKLARTENMFPHELSGGMKRRVGIARALCTDPEIALFDEPTSGLDPVTSTIILNMIQELALTSESAQSKALLVATSNVEIAIRFAERVIIINDGVVVGDGPWKDLLLNGSEWVKNFLGVRFLGLDLSYAKELNLPQEFIAKHW